MYIVLVDPDSGSRLQELISPVGKSRENIPVLSVSYHCQGLLQLVLLGVYGLS